MNRHKQMLYDPTYTESRMVIARGMVSYLTDIEFQFYKWRVLCVFKETELG